MANSIISVRPRRIQLPQEDYGPSPHSSRLLHDSRRPLEPAASTRHTLPLVPGALLPAPGGLRAVPLAGYRSLLPVLLGHALLLHVRSFPGLRIDEHGALR